jgi:IclR family pca regulon transcriptional regulator
VTAPAGENVPDARYSVHSLELGLRILESFDRDAIDEMSLSEMARRIGVSRSSAFRLVHTLQRLGYLEREDETKNYRLGARVMSLGYSFLASKDIAELARPDLQRLRNATRCSTHLGILDGAEVIYIARFAAHKPVSAMIAVGARVPAHATTMGRIILAFKPAAYVAEHFGGRPLAKFSEQTPVTLEALAGMLDADRRRGYVISHSNFEAGIASIAAPIFDAKGEIVGAINVSTPENAIDVERFDSDVCDALRAAARRISELSGYREAAFAS